MECSILQAITISRYRGYQNLRPYICGIHFHLILHNPEPHTGLGSRPCILYVTRNIIVWNFIATDEYLPVGILGKVDITLF